MNCHRVISKDVNSQISIFLFYILRKTTGINWKEIFYSMQQIKGLGLLFNKSMKTRDNFSL